MGKIATPITLKTFLPADEKVGDLTIRNISRGLPPRP
jgi:hypothetical protein